MKHPILFLASLLAGSIAASAQEPADSLPTVELGEVTVKAATVIRKVDRDLYMPSASTRERSLNGLSLIDNMQMPGVGVNTMLQTINVNGQTPELRINNRRTTIEKIMGLDPASVVRVEVITNPGVRYRGANSVINVIVRNPESGGNAWINAMQAVDKEFTNLNGSMNLNYGKSQIEIATNEMIRRHIRVWRENTERFELANHAVITRNETNSRGHINYNNTWNGIAYSFANPDKLNIYAAANLATVPPSGDDYQGDMLSNVDSLSVSDRNSNRSVSPNFHFYLDKAIGRKQTLAVDIDTRFQRSHSLRDYMETQLGNPSEEITNISNRVRDNNFSIAAELLYIKEWEKARFTAGGSIKLQRAKSTYLSLANQIFHQHLDLYYLYAEYMRQFGPVAITAGLSGESWHTSHIENNLTSTSTKLSPDLTLQWRINGANRLRLHFNTYTTTPTLTESTPVVQQIDSYQSQTGNHDLRPFNNYRADLDYSFSSSWITGNLNAYWRRSPGAIMEYSHYGDNGRIVNSWDNMTGFTEMGVRLSPRVTVVPGWLTVNGSVEFSHQADRGTGYRHRYNCVIYDLTAMLNYRRFTLSATMMRGQRRLWGETITRGESITMCALMYAYRRVSFNLGVIMPWGKYELGSERRGRMVSYNRSTRLNFRVIGLGINYSIDWGRRTRTVNRLTNTSATTDQSKAASK